VREANRHVLLFCVLPLLLALSPGCAWINRGQVADGKGMHGLGDRIGRHGRKSDFAPAGAWQYQSTTWRPLAPGMMNLDQGGMPMDGPTSQKGMVEDAPNHPVYPQTDGYPRFQPPGPMETTPAPATPSGQVESPHNQQTPLRTQQMPLHTQPSPLHTQQAAPVEEIPLPPLHSQGMENSPEGSPEAPVQPLPTPSELTPGSQEAPGQQPLPGDAPAVEPAPAAEKPTKPAVPYMVIPPLRSNSSLRPSVLFAPKSSLRTEASPVPQSSTP
jgi:hypothetical protein